MTIMTLIKAVTTKLPTPVYIAVWPVDDCDVAEISNMSITWNSMYVRIIWRYRKSNDRQHNGQAKNNKRTNHDLQNTTQKAKDRTTWTPLKLGMMSDLEESTVPAPHVTLVAFLLLQFLIYHVWGRTGLWWFFFLTVESYTRVCFHSSR